MPMGSKLNNSLRGFIERQHVFFVATAGPGGRVNVSPKGADSLRIKSDTALRWLNLSGSGNETAGHLRLSDRITLMFAAFDGDPLILRVYGRGTVLHPRDVGWEAALAEFPPMAGSRQVIDVTIDGVQTSCGTGVPVMPFARDRVQDELLPFYEDMGPDGVRDYWRRKNLRTIDGYDTALSDE
ncbi:MAG: pyridoxamine 5'-phosphate oxidase family protein [Pseudomonadota bacterium]